MKIATYENFLKEKDALSFDEAMKIYEDIIDSADSKDSDFLELWEEFLANAFEYTNIRVGWSLKTTEEKREKDEARTAKHNDTIRSLRMISRYLAAQDKDVSWIEILDTDRKVLGDFANYITYIYALNER